MSLPLGDLAVCLALSTTLFIAVEVQKWFRRRLSQTVDK